MKYKKIFAFKNFDVELYLEGNIFVPTCYTLKDRVPKYRKCANKFCLSYRKRWAPTEDGGRTNTKENTSQFLLRELYWILTTFIHMSKLRVLSVTS